MPIKTKINGNVAFWEDMWIKKKKKKNQHRSLRIFLMYLLLQEFNFLKLLETLFLIFMNNERIVFETLFCIIVAEF